MAAAQSPCRCFKTRVLHFKVKNTLLNLQYKFTVQRVNEALFFEVTTLRSCKAVNGFHSVTFGPGGKAIISVSVIFLVSTFKSFLSFQEFFPPFVGYFSKRAREPEGKLCHIVYEV